MCSFKPTLIASITDPRRESGTFLSTPVSPDGPVGVRRWNPDFFPALPSSAGTTGRESAEGTSLEDTDTPSTPGGSNGNGTKVKRPLPTMDDYLFMEHVRSCRVIHEDTRYLEIFNYEGSQQDYREEHRLPEDEFLNFFNRTGVFAPYEVKKGPKCLHGMRLVYDSQERQTNSSQRLPHHYPVTDSSTRIQKNAKHPETFSPQYISFSHDHYEAMVRGMKLPYRAIESTSVVGPFFWSSFDRDDNDPHLLIVFRKSDVRKKGRTRGWELMLSYSFRTRITSGFIKGTPSSDVEMGLQHLMACAGHVVHPMLLPIILLSLDMGGKDEVRQRETRDWTRRLENAISMRDEIDHSESPYIKDGVIDLDAINRDLVECHSQVLWKRPRAYREVIREIETGMDRFAETEVEWNWRNRTKSNTSRTSCDREGESSTDEDEAAERKSIGSNESFEKKRVNRMRNHIKFSEDNLDPETRSIHRSMQGRLEFYTCKLMGLENYAHTTLERLNIQREVLYYIHARTGSKLSLKMAGEQRRLSHATKRDSTAMKTLSLMGALFLPATLISSVFSMTFFDFQVGENSPLGEYRTISPDLWIYFVVTIPITLVIVGTWFWWDMHREKRLKIEDDNIDNDITVMENDIIKSTRKRTRSRYNTFDIGRRQTATTI